MTDKTTNSYIPGLNKKTECSSKCEATFNKTEVIPSGTITAQSSHTAELSEEKIKVVDKKVIVEKIPETHFETKYVTKTIPVSVPVQEERTVVTAVQETKEIPVTKFVERIETVPIKKVEQVTEYKTVPVTKLEEVIENIPVKKIVAHTEYQKVPVTKLVEKIENVPVTRVEPVTHYEQVTTTTPVKPTNVENFNATVATESISSSSTTVKRN
jgi:hypothetical protein